MFFIDTQQEQPMNGCISPALSVTVVIASAVAASADPVTIKGRTVILKLRARTVAIKGL